MALYEQIALEVVVYVKSTIALRLLRDNYAYVRLFRFLEEFASSLLNKYVIKL